MGDDRFEPDEEEQRYAQLREETQRDPTRSRKTPKWEAPVFVAHWQCRNAKCRAQVGLIVEGGDHFAMFNKILRDRGEPPMRSDEVLVCDACRKMLNEAYERKYAKQRDEIVKPIRDLKAHEDPGNATDLHAELERLGHPDVKGLIQWCKDQRAKSKRRTVSKDDV